MAVAVPSTLPMKLWRAEARGKAAAAAGPDDPLRVLVTVTVLGSAGPLRFIVLEGDTVAALIRGALRCYAREGRMPLLGTDPAGFVLSTANGGSGGTERHLFVGIGICPPSSRLTHLFTHLFAMPVQHSEKTRGSASTGAGTSCFGRRLRLRVPPPTTPGPML